MNEHIRNAHETEAVTLGLGGLKEFKCDRCPYEANRQYKIDMHAKAVHDQIKPHLCTYCGYKTASKKYLREHISRVHEPKKHRPKTFMCEQCTFATATKCVLTNHIKVVHEKLKPHKCSMCPYETSQKYHLNEHVRAIHTKEKPFKCDHCSYEFAKKWNLTEHVRHVHEKVRRKMRNIRINCDKNNIIPPII